jgi:uncharacterized protein (DUF983 family)
MAISDLMYAAVPKNKCPRCHEGKVFENNNPYNFHNGLTMYKHCPSCGLKYERETGYFYGAMYVSYGLQVAVFASLFALNTIWWHLQSSLIIAVIICSVVSVFPITFRTSRIMWVALFTKYEKDFLAKHRHITQPGKQV